ncbi:hypothetical protein BC829DRAFT_433037 [Chytridium lagenaria]|nr:hypothetical protein BC829DRAFT_433037 [Chytridium lagenaria]
MGGKGKQLQESWMRRAVRRWWRSNPPVLQKQVPSSEFCSKGTGGVLAREVMAVNPSVFFCSMVSSFPIESWLSQFSNKAAPSLSLSLSLTQSAFEDEVDGWMDGWIGDGCVCGGMKWRGWLFDGGERDGG